MIDWLIVYCFTLILFENVAFIWRHPGMLYLGLLLVYLWALSKEKYSTLYCYTPAVTWGTCFLQSNPKNSFYKLWASLYEISVSMHHLWTNQVSDTYMYIIAQWFKPYKNVGHVPKIFFCLCWSLNLGPLLTQQFSTLPIDHYPEPVLRNVIFLPHLEHPNQTWSSSGAQTNLTAWINRFELLNIYKNTTTNFDFQTNMC